MRAHDDFDGLVKQRVFFAAAAAVGAAVKVELGLLGRQDFFHVIGLAELFQIIHHAVHFFVGDKCAVHALRIACAGGQEQHVALPQQVFRAHLV